MEPITINLKYTDSYNSTHYIESVIKGAMVIIEYDKIFKRTDLSMMSDFIGEKVILNKILFDGTIESYDGTLNCVNDGGLLIDNLTKANG